MVGGLMAMCAQRAYDQRCRTCNLLVFSSEHFIFDECPHDPNVITKCDDLISSFNNIPFGLKLSTLCKRMCIPNSIANKYSDFVTTDGIAVQSDMLNHIEQVIKRPVNNLNKCTYINYALLYNDNDLPSDQQLSSWF